MKKRTPPQCLSCPATASTTQTKRFPEVLSSRVGQGSGTDGKDDKEQKGRQQGLIRMDSKNWIRHLRFKVMEARARIQRKGSDFVAKGSTVTLNLSEG